MFPDLQLGPELLSSDGCGDESGGFVDRQEDLVVGLRADFGELGQVDVEVVLVGHRDADPVDVGNPLQGIHLEPMKKGFKGLSFNA